MHGAARRDPPPRCRPQRVVLCADPAARRSPTRSSAGRPRAASSRAVTRRTPRARTPPTPAPPARTRSPTVRSSSNGTSDTTYIAELHDRPQREPAPSCIVELRLPDPRYARTAHGALIPRARTRTGSLCVPARHPARARDRRHQQRCDDVHAGRGLHRARPVHIHGERRAHDHAPRFAVPAGQRAGTPPTCQAPEPIEVRTNSGDRFIVFSCFDPGGDPVTIVLEDQPDHGQITESFGAHYYKPTAGYQAPTPSATTPTTSNGSSRP